MNAISLRYDGILDNIAEFYGHGSRLLRRLYVSPCNDECPLVAANHAHYNKWGFVINLLEWKMIFLHGNQFTKKMDLVAFVNEMPSM